MNTDGTIMQFLQGSHSFDGVWFGDDHPEHKGKFWWRKFLPRESPAPAKTAEEVEKAILDAADEHGFRVPYDGSNKFYDETAVKSFISGAKWMQDCTALRTQPCQTGYSRDDLKDTIAQSMTSVYCCTRVWEAWQVGTMTQDDFIPAVEEDDFIDSLTDAILSLTNKPTE